MAVIKAREKWNETPFVLEQGETYRFTAGGKWLDAGTPYDATGHDSDNFVLRWAEPLRRVREARWFSLIGAIDRDNSACFDIGRVISSGGTYTASRSGPLFCFANDVWFMYWNNSGEVELEVEQCEH